MGREALVDAQVGTEHGEVRALLESSELILRGAIRRRFARSGIRDVRVDGEVLRLRAGDEEVALRLGQTAAVGWAAGIAKPPPTLRMKLGLTEGKIAFGIGQISDEQLAEAVAERLTSDLGLAHMIIAVVFSAADLARSERVHAMNPSLPIWIVYPKGRNVTFGDTYIRELLRARGLRDTKSCAVTDVLTATRYSRLAKDRASSGQITI